MCAESVLSNCSSPFQFSGSCLRRQTAFPSTIPCSISTFDVVFFEPESNAPSSTTIGWPAGRQSSEERIRKGISLYSKKELISLYGVLLCLRLSSSFSFSSASRNNNITSVATSPSSAPPHPPVGIELVRVVSCTYRKSSSCCRLDECYLRRPDSVVVTEKRLLIFTLSETPVPSVANRGITPVTKPVVAIIEVQSKMEKHGRRNRRMRLRQHPIRRETLHQNGLARSSVRVLYFSSRRRRRRRKIFTCAKLRITRKPFGNSHVAPQPKGDPSKSYLMVSSSLCIRRLFKSLAAGLRFEK